MAFHEKIPLLLAAALTLAGCDPQAVQQDTDAEQAAPPPVAVTTLTVQRENIPLHFDYVGQVAGSLEVEIRSRITGIIEQRHFDEGGEVSAGQLLYTLDDAQYRAQHQQALAAIDSARAQKITAEAQLSKAQRELRRVTPLADKQMLSRNQQDDAASSVEIASAQVAVAEAAIKQAEANLLTSKVNLDYTRIRAPVDGTVGRALQNRGALVQAGSNSLLTTLVRIDPVHVDFGVPEREWISIRNALASGELKLAGERLSVDLLDQDQPMGRDGRLDFTDYKVDLSTGNFALRAVFDNPDRKLSPGQFVKVRLGGAYRSDSLAIPQRAVLDGAAGKYVYVAVAGEQATVAMQRQLELGAWVDLDDQRRNYWVVESGLEAGDQVIVDGVARIFFPGMPVTPDNGTQSGSDAAPAE
jgi:membrane fusion protein (multidrug efflux system)